MSRVAYRLWTIKDEQRYIDNGLTKEQAQQVIDYLWDVDEDYTSKREYIKNAVAYQKQVKEKLGIDVDWKVIFDDITSKKFISDWRYCSKCGTYYWADDYCECD